MLFDKSHCCRGGVVIAFGITLAVGGYCTVAADKAVEKQSTTPDAKSQNSANENGADSGKAGHDKTDQAKYIRITRNSKNRVIGLDTAIISFRPSTAAQPTSRSIWSPPYTSPTKAITKS